MRSSAADHLGRGDRVDLLPRRHRRARPGTAPGWPSRPAPLRSASISVWKWGGWSSRGSLVTSWTPGCESACLPGDHGRPRRRPRPALARVRSVPDARPPTAPHLHLAVGFAAAPSSITVAGLALDHYADLGAQCSSGCAPGSSSRSRSLPHADGARPDLVVVRRGHLRRDHRVGHLGRLQSTGWATCRCSCRRGTGFVYLTGLRISQSRVAAPARPGLVRAAIAAWPPVGAAGPVRRPGAGRRRRGLRGARAAPLPGQGAARRPSTPASSWPWPSSRSTARPWGPGAGRRRSPASGCPTATPPAARRADTSSSTSPPSPWRPGCCRPGAGSGP